MRSTAAMKLGKTLFSLGVLALGSWWTLAMSADAPLIAPTIEQVSPPGIERGTKAVLTIEGRNLVGARAVLFDSPGLTARILSVADLPPEPAPPKPANTATVPLGTK